MSERAGLFMEGLFIGAESRTDGNGLNVLVACGVDAFKVKVKAIPKPFEFGQPIVLQVSCTAFNGKCYYSGAFVD